MRLIHRVPMCHGVCARFYHCFLLKDFVGYLVFEEKNVKVFNRHVITYNYKRYKSSTGT